MKALNTYAGLGGNRKKWTGVEVTAVEYREDIAGFYQDQFPDDTVIVGDAHQYLLDHYVEFDFIWSSPPCPIHSTARYWKSKGAPDKVAPVYPAMELWQEIIFLKNWFAGDWVVENVNPYYDIQGDVPDLPPHTKLGRHLFWSNYHIPSYKADDADIQGGKRADWEKHHGISLEGYKFQDRTDKLLRNCVDADLGLHVFESAKGVNPETISQLSFL